MTWCQRRKVEIAEVNPENKKMSLCSCLLICLWFTFNLNLKFPKSHLYYNSFNGFQLPHRDTLIVLIISRNRTVSIARLQDFIYFYLIHVLCRNQQYFTYTKEASIMVTNYTNLLHQLNMLTHIIFLCAKRITKNRRQKYITFSSWTILDNWWPLATDYMLRLRGWRMHSHTCWTVSSDNIFFSSRSLDKVCHLSCNSAAVTDGASPSGASLSPL